MSELPWDRYGEPAEPELPYRPPTWTAHPAPVSPPEPTPDPPNVGPSDIVKADARSRSKRTLVQGLAFDLLAAAIASVAMLSGADPFQKETWVAFAVLLVKSFVSAAISYFMRLRSTPTIRTRGEKLAIMPVPQRIPEKELP